MPSKALGEMKSPTRKLASFFMKSRDAWKSKYLALKKQLVSMENQVYAVEKSRAEWRTRAKEAEAQLAKLREESKKRDPQTT
jgi:predicted  nucleic acid-binding Zn-ribbon protein